MTAGRQTTLFSSAGLAALSALALAACGGGGTATAAAPLPTSHGQAKTVGVGTTRLGTILINSQGHTLYLFKGDTGTTSTCTGACATAWPPLLATGKPTVNTGAKASLTGTTRRSDGTQQVTYNGHPVYLFIKDTKPGSTAGQGLSAFGAQWFALTPTGHQVSTPTPSSSGASSGGGGGY